MRSILLVVALLSVSSLEARAGAPRLASPDSLDILSFIRASVRPTAPCVADSITLHVDFCDPCGSITSTELVSPYHVRIFATTSAPSDSAPSDSGGVIPCSERPCPMNQLEFALGTFPAGTNVIDVELVESVILGGITPAYEVVVRHQFVPSTYGQRVEPCPARSPTSTKSASASRRNAGWVRRSQADAADPARGGRHEQPAEGAGDDGEGDACARRAAAVRGGRHPELRVRLFVHTAGRAVARFVQRRAHAAPRAQLRLEPVEAARVAVLTGADAEHPLEGAQQSMGRDARLAAQRGETRGRSGCASISRHTVRTSGTPGSGAAARPAAAATGAEARQLRRLRHREEGDLRAPRPPAGTRGPAIDARRLHRVDERAVVAAIALQHDAPAALGRQVGNNSGTAHAGELSALPCRDLSDFGR